MQTTHRRRPARRAQGARKRRRFPQDASRRRRARVDPPVGVSLNTKSSTSLASQREPGARSSRRRVHRSATQPGPGRRHRRGQDKPNDCDRAKLHPLGLAGITSFCGSANFTEATVPRCAIPSHRSPAIEVLTPGLDTSTKCPNTELEFHVMNKIGKVSSLKVPALGKGVALLGAIAREPGLSIWEVRAVSRDGPTRELTTAPSLTRVAAQNSETLQLCS